jgi:PhnB protein
MKSLTTYPHFDGNCRTAMAFYQRCLGGELQLRAYPDAGGTPSTDPDARIMHASLTRAGAPTLMASDSSPEGPVQPGDNFSVSVECESLLEIERLFGAIGERGKVRLALADMPWGARFGMLTDSSGSSGCSTARKRMRNSTGTSIGSWSSFGKTSG